MEPFLQVSGRIAALPASDIDTDVIMPKQFLKGIDRAGLDRGVFYDLRFLADGEEDSSFILNQPGWRGSAFLVVGPNFGCGSSREHAVWGLKQLGVRAIFSTSFAGIFYDNCGRNALLAGIVTAADADRLLLAAQNEHSNKIMVDLAASQIHFSNRELLPFVVPDILQRRLLKGQDLIGETLAASQKILAFEMGHLAKSPWLSPDTHRASRPSRPIGPEN